MIRDLLAAAIAAPITLVNLALDAFTSDDTHRRADAALILVVILLVIGWALGVFKE